MFASLIMKDYIALKAAIQTRTLSQRSAIWPGGKKSDKNVETVPHFQLNRTPLPS